MAQPPEALDYGGFLDKGETGDRSRADGVLFLSLQHRTDGKRARLPPLQKNRLPSPNSFYAHPLDRSAQAPATDEGPAVGTPGEIRRVNFAGKRRVRQSRLAARQNREGYDQFWKQVRQSDTPVCCSCDAT